MTIKTKLFEANDSDILLSWISSEAEMKQWAGPKIFSWPLDKSQLIKYASRSEEINSEALIYSVYNNQNIIGHFGLDPIDRNNKSAVLQRVIIAPNSRGRGHGIDLVNAALHVGFNELNLKEIGLKVYTFNEPAIRCYEKCGFKTIEIVKNACVVNEKSWDMAIMHIKNNATLF